jgi:predicted alpha/beta-fold hydrolase
MFAGEPLHLIGFSLGGNFMLRVAAQADAGLEIANVIAVSPVLDPGATLAALEDGFRPYHRYFVRKWLASLFKKQAAWPGDYDFTEFARVPDLRLLTEQLVVRYTEFASLDEYLNGYAITGDELAKLNVPSSLITAHDDPIIPIAGLKKLAQPAALSVIVTRHGGHCGFLENLVAPSWVERRIVAQLASALPEVVQA